MAWGYVANRVYGAMIREAARVAEEGIASREEIDALMIDCFRWPSRPVRHDPGSAPAAVGRRADLEFHAIRIAEE